MRVGYKSKNSYAPGVQQHRCIAQRLEYSPDKRKVDGSNPSTPTILEK